MKRIVYIALMIILIITYFFSVYDYLEVESHSASIGDSLFSENDAYTTG